MHESQPNKPSAYPGTDSVDPLVTQAAAAAESEAAEEPEVEKAPSRSLADRLAWVKKIPSPAQVLPKKSHRIAAASGLSTAALGAAATWNQFFGGSTPPDPAKGAKNPPAASSPAEPGEKAKSPTLQIHNAPEQAPSPEMAALPVPLDTGPHSPPIAPVDETATTDLVPPAPTPIAVAEQPPDSHLLLDDPGVPPLADVTAPVPLDMTEAASEPAVPDSDIIAPPPTLVTGAESAEPLSVEQPILPAEPNLPEMPTPLAAAATGAAFALAPDPQPVDLTTAEPLALTDPGAKPPPAEPTPAAAPIPNLAATPEPAAAEVPTAPQYPELDEADMVALPNSGTRPIQIAQPVGEPRRYDPAPVALASASTPAATTSGSQTQLAITDAIDPVQHVVQRGENFYTISRLYYGSGRFYKALWKANADQFKKPEDLHVGAQIKVPPPEALDRFLIEPASAPDPRAAAQPEATPAAASNLTTLPRGTTLRPTQEIAPPTIADSGRTYTVESDNETLRTIARDKLGDPHRDEEIRNLNLETLGDRTRLVRGMQLRLPR